MVNPVGRPRERDREKIMNDMLEWAKRDESINLCEFCCLFVDPPLPPSDLTKFAKSDSEFGKAYEATKAFIGFRRERKLNNQELHVKAYDLNAATYDYFLKEEKRQQAEFEAELKKSEESTPQKVVFEVNYKNDHHSPIDVSSTTLPTSDTTSA